MKETSGKTEQEDRAGRQRVKTEREDREGRQSGKTGEDLVGDG